MAFDEWIEMFRDAWTAPGWRNKFLYVFWKSRLAP